ncbi:MAG: DUF1573 domain-containing protein [Prevotellaceae bacterium]|nr:DUF1573 domain-containing protein [Prevotellaceae bacterium]
MAHIKTIIAIAYDTKRALSLLVLFATATLAALAQPLFVPDTDIKKMGEVEFQIPRTLSIGFTNKGDKPLIIQEVKASCGCIDILYPKAPVAAGARGEITLTFDAKLLGTFYKEIEVLTNASEEPKYIGIHGVVVTEVKDYSDEFPFDLGNVRMETNTIEFEDVSLGDQPTAELRVLNTDHTAYRPELMHLPAYLTAEYEPKDIPAGKSGKIRLTLDSEKLNQLGLNQTSIYLSRYLGDKIGETNEILVSAILLPSFANMTDEALATAPELTVSESTVSMEVKNGKKAASHTVTLANTGKSDLHIQQVQVFNKAISVSISDRTIRPNKSTRLKISVTARYLNKDKGRMRVLLVTDAPRQAKQYINVEVANPK